jgi:radical SAM protein with 4Fe4S-binding SPASM domain
VKSSAPRSLPYSYFTLELTRSCNNACRHCYNFWRSGGRIERSSDRPALSRAEIRSIVGRVARDTPLEYVAVTGGEPFLRPDCAEIVGDLVDAGFKAIVITNGALLTSSQLRRLPEGINFEVTLLGHTAALHNRLAGAAVFDTILRNLIRIPRAGSRFVTTFVSTRLNALDVFRTYELAAALGAGAIMYNRVNLSRGAKPYVAELVTPAGMLKESLTQLQDAVRKYKIPAVCSVPIPPCVVDVADFPDLQFGWCPRGGRDAYYTVDPTGLLRPCNHSSVVLGDLRTQDFAEIVTSRKTRVFWEGTPTECAQCRHPLKAQCRGGCPAAADEFYGRRLMDPFCRLARAAPGPPAQPAPEARARRRAVTGRTSVSSHY